MDKRICEDQDTVTRELQKLASAGCAQAPVIYLLVVSGEPRGWTADPIWAGQWASQLRERDALPLKEITPSPNKKRGMENEDDKGNAGLEAN